MNDAAEVFTAISFFGAIVVAIRSFTGVWMKRLELRREIPPVATLANQLERIEAAIEVMAVEIERISEAQRFSARLLSERDPARLPASAMTPESRVVTPH